MNGSDWTIRIALCALLTAAGAHPATTTPSRPDVLLVTLDTVRADHLGAYGYADARTPTIDALARSGVVFDNAFTSAPMTLPAHATLLTGLEPPEHGVRVNGMDQLPADVSTLAEALAATGYRTSAFVSAFVLNARFGLARGFATYDDDFTRTRPQTMPEPLSVSRSADLVVDATLAWLGPLLDDPERPPFFCWLHLYDAHRPYFVHDELAGTRFAGQASYDAAIAFADLELARVIDLLRSKGRLAQTLVVVVGDHGEGLGELGETEHGYRLSKGTLRIPLLMTLDGQTRPGTRITALVSLADVFPTILELASITVRREGAGRSLRAGLRGNSMQSRPSYAETLLPYSTYRWSPQQALVTDRWRYVRSTRPELYDRTSDAREERDVARDHPTEVARLDTELVARESTFKRRAAERAALDDDARRRLEALGYVVSSGGADAPPAGLKDIKAMLSVKHLDGRLGRTYYAGRMSRQRAIAITRKLVRHSPESPPFHQNLGTLLAEDGRTSEAMEHLREALRLDPGRADVQAQLDALLRQR